MEAVVTELLNATKLNSLLRETTDYMRETRQRYGQALWNLAEEKYPNLVKPLRETEKDCFHIQKNINPFLKAISMPHTHGAIDEIFY